MAALRWVAEGIEIAGAAGGVTLDRRTRLGFVRDEVVVERPRAALGVSGFPIDVDPDPYDDE